MGGVWGSDDPQKKVKRTFVTVCLIRNDLYCVEWGVKLYSLTHALDLTFIRMIEMYI